MELTCLIRIVCRSKTLCICIENTAFIRFWSDAITGSAWNRAQMRVYLVKLTVAARRTTP